MELCNIPEVKLGVIAVSRSCFPASLSRRRRETLKAAYGGGLYECPVIVGGSYTPLPPPRASRKLVCRLLLLKKKK